MDETFRQNAQDNINHENRGDDQQRLASKGVLKGLSGPLKGGSYAIGFLDVFFQLLDGGDRIAQKCSGRQIEGQRYGREWSEVVDCQRGKGRVQVCDSVQRNLLSCVGEFDPNCLQPTPSQI